MALKGVGQAGFIFLTVIIITVIFVIPSLALQANVPGTENYQNFIMAITGLSADLISFPQILATLVVPFASVLAIITLMIDFIISRVNDQLASNKGMIFLIALGIAMEMLLGPTIGWPGINIVAQVFIALGWYSLAFFITVIVIGSYLAGKLFGKSLGVVKSLEREETQLASSTAQFREAKEVEQEKKVLLSKLVEWDAAFENYKETANPKSDAVKKGTGVHNDIVRIIYEFDKGNYSVASVSRLKQLADKAESIKAKF